MKTGEHQEMRRNPINREKYVRDTIRYKSRNKAVRIQKPHMSPATANNVAVRLDAEPVVQRLKAGIEEKMVDLNAKRLFKLTNHLDSDDEKVSMDAVKEAGKVIERYQDRTEGKAKQFVSVQTTKLNISLDLSGKAATMTQEVAESKDDLIEGEISE